MHTTTQSDQVNSFPNGPSTQPLHDEEAKPSLHILFPRAGFKVWSADLVFTIIKPASLSTAELYQLKESILRRRHAK